MLLSELFSGQPDVEITGLTLDSRTVKPGYMFFCIKGYEQDGHRYAGSAAEKGAAAIVITEDVEQKPGVVYIRVADMNAELNRVCDLFFGQPSRHMTVNLR